MTLPQIHYIRQHLETENRKIYTAYYILHWTGQHCLLQNAQLIPSVLGSRNVRTDLLRRWRHIRHSDRSNAWRPNTQTSQIYISPTPNAMPCNKKTPYVRQCMYKRFLNMNDIVTWRWNLDSLLIKILPENTHEYACKDFRPLNTPSHTELGPRFSKNRSQNPGIEHATRHY